MILIVGLPAARSGPAACLELRARVDRSADDLDLSAPLHRGGTHRQLSSDAAGSGAHRAHPEAGAARTGTLTRGGETRPVVADPQPQPFAAGAERHRPVRGVAVTGGVGDRLARDPYELGALGRTRLGLVGCLDAHGGLHAE